MTLLEFLPCPFCGQVEFCECVEVKHTDRRVYHPGKRETRRRIVISHQVQCGNCGAAGPTSIEVVTEELTEEHVAGSQQAAIFNWNKRLQISDRAFELVNKLIASAVLVVDQPKGMMTTSDRSSE